jgi:hypothetical protein
MADDSRQAGSEMQFLDKIEREIRDDWERRGLIGRFPSDIDERTQNSIRDLQHIFQRFG